MEQPAFHACIAARVTLMCAALFASPFVFSAERMNNAQIKTLLTDRIVHGSKDGRDWTQHFNRDGTTQYSSEQNVSRGEWKVDGDRYCSVWPPNATWSCWLVEARPGGFAFVNENSGDVWEAKVHGNPKP